jgi:hypothetical protein
MEATSREAETDGTRYRMSRAVRGRAPREIRKSMVERVRRASRRLSAGRRGERAA